MGCYSCPESNSLIVEVVPERERTHPRKHSMFVVVLELEHCLAKMLSSWTFEICKLLFVFWGVVMETCMV